MSAVTGESSASIADASSPLNPIARDHGDDPLARAMAAAAADPARIADVLRELAGRRVWVPLPGSEPIVAGAAVTLPLLTYQGAEFVPAFTRPALLRRWSPAADPGADSAGPHLVVGAADLAGVLPADVGVALNPGTWPSVAVSPDGMAELLAAGDPGRAAAPGLAAPHWPATGRQAPRRPGGAAGPVPAGVSARLAAACVALAAHPAARSATAGWLSTGSGDLLVIAVRLDRPSDDAVQQLVGAAIAGRSGQDRSGFGVEVIFPGASPQDFAGAWVTDFGTLFYQR